MRLLDCLVIVGKVLILFTNVNCVASEDSQLCSLRLFLKSTLDSIELDLLVSSVLGNLL